MVPVTIDPALIARVMKAHPVTGGYDRIKHSEYDQCMTCKTKHPTYTNDRWPTHAEHVAAAIAAEVAQSLNSQHSTLNVKVAR